MRLNKLNLAIKLALEIKPPEDVKPFIFDDGETLSCTVNIGAAYALALSDFINKRYQKVVNAMGVQRKLLGERNA